MRSRSYKTAGFLLLSFLCLAPVASTRQHKQEKTVWNYDDGVRLMTDGSVPNGPCFRISGHVTAPHFFENLKRVDSKDEGVTFHRGSETVKTFPDRLILSFAIRDLPCPTQYLHTSSQPYLTRSIISSMHLSFYWKRGIELRPIKNAIPAHFSVEPVVPYAADLARDLPEKFVWSYEFSIPSARVPLSDSLVLILRTEDNRIAARVAARL